jgi:hypothetical protein
VEQAWCEQHTHPESGLQGSHWAYPRMAEAIHQRQRSRSQFATLKRGQNIKYLVYAFTEHGALMAAKILNSPRAVAMSAKQNVCSNHRANPSQHFRVCVFACCFLLSQFQLFPSPLVLPISAFPKASLWRPSPARRTAICSETSF